MSYCQLIEEQGAEVQVVFANNPREILNHTRKVLTCDIHSRMRTKRILKEAGAEVVCGMDDILNAPVDGSGCNEKYGLLGSNKSTEDTIKLFPRDCMDLVNDIQKIWTGQESMWKLWYIRRRSVQGSVGKIWELADPVVSVANTEGLEARRSKIKISG